MPFVYTCPDPKTILNRLDKLFVYGNYEQIQLAEAQLSLPFTFTEDRNKRLGEFALLCGAAETCSVDYNMFNFNVVNNSFSGEFPVTVGQT